MPKTQDSLNTELYDLLVSRGFDPETLDSDGNDTEVPESAEVFQIEYRSNGKDYGTVTLSVDGVRNLSIYFNDTVLGKNAAQESNWTGFIKQLKRFAHTHQLGFKLKNLDRLKNDMKKRAHTKRMNNSISLSEGYYGTRHTSYTDNQPSTIKMIIKHNKSIGESDQRFRHIERIFLENEQGERILVPSTKPSVGRVFARHLAEGGEYNDDRWTHIKQISEDIGKLGGFVRATRRKQFNESATRMISEATEQYQQLRETMKRLTSSRGYHKYFESWTPTLLEADSDNLSEFFRSSSIDPRIEAALPVLGRLNIKVTEIQEADQFESWADNILDEVFEAPVNEDADTRGKEEDLLSILGPDSEMLPVGPDAMSVIGEIDGIFDDENTEQLYARLRRVAKNDPDSDARPVIIAWMEEHSDNGQFDEVLDQLETDDEEVEQLAPAEPEPATETPPAPQANVPPPPPLPPVKESEEDGVLSRIRKLSGL